MKHEQGTEDAMEWEPSETEVINTLHDIRRDISLVSHSNRFEQNLKGGDSCAVPADLHVIVDTNILLLHLPVVKMLLDRRSCDKNIRVYIPWMVLQELDFMKTKREEKNRIEISARKAASFLFKEIQEKNPFFRVQTIDEFKSCISLLSDENGDDKMLEWCLYLQKEEQQKMILLSNDIMFCTKASASGIEAMPKEQFVEKLSDMLASAPSLAQADVIPVIKVGVIPKKKVLNGVDASTFLSRFKQLLQIPLSHVIEYEMKLVFGDMWRKIVIVKPPWNLEDIIRCLDKHWIAVFSYIYSKDFRQKFDYLNGLLKEAMPHVLIQVKERDTLIETGICILQSIHRKRKLFEPHVKNAIGALETLKLKDQPSDALVMEMFTSLWDRFNTTCGAIADALNVSHNLQCRINSSVLSQKEAEDGLNFLLPLVEQMECIMSR